VTQRWREGRASYRPAGEPIDPRRYGVELIDRDAVARDYVCRHHYSGSYPAARLRVGLYRGRELVGVAVLSVPVTQRAIPAYAPGLAPRQGVELGRLVLADDVPANGETWFLARIWAAVRSELPEVRAILSYSDPVPRRTHAGHVVTPGHVGTIYQAHNGRLVGRSSPRTQLLDAHGRVISGRLLSKIRLGETGVDYACRELARATGHTRRPGEDGAAYVARATADLRRLRHPGCWAYAWPLYRGVDLVSPGLTYPKAPEPGWVEGALW
jgi:hypothetical protein